MITGRDFDCLVGKTKQNRDVLLYAALFCFVTVKVEDLTPKGNSGMLYYLRRWCSAVQHWDCE